MTGDLNLLDYEHPCALCVHPDRHWHIARPDGQPGVAIITAAALEQALANGLTQRR